MTAKWLSFNSGAGRGIRRLRRFARILSAQSNALRDFDCKLSAGDFA